MPKNHSKTRVNAALFVAAAAGLGLTFAPRASRAQSVTGNANFSGNVEGTGHNGSSPALFTTSSFAAAGPSAASNYPEFGVVTFNANSFAALAASGVSATANLSAVEFVSTSASTVTLAGSVLNFYFAQSPATGTALGTSSTSAYNASNSPGGFDASNFKADLVGSFTYANVNNQRDSIGLTFSAGDVSYINSVLTAGSGTFELFAVATTPTGSARYDGTFSTALAMLTLNGATGTGIPTGFLTFDQAGAGANGTPNFTTSSATTDFTDSGTGKDVPFASGNTVNFTDAGLAGGARTISIDTAGVAPTGVVVNTTGTYTFAGSGPTGITGAATLTKAGTGTLVVNNANSYTGTTTVSGGTLQVASDAALGTGGITLSGGTLNLTAPITEAPGTTAAGAPVRSVAFSGTSNTINTNGNAIVFGGASTGAGPLTIAGSGGSVTFANEVNASSIGAVTVPANTSLSLLTTSTTTPYVTVGSGTLASTIDGNLNLGSSGNPIELELTTGATFNGSGSIVVASGGEIQTYSTSTAAFTATFNPNVSLGGGSAGQTVIATTNKTIVFNGTVSTSGTGGLTVGATPVIYNGDVDSLSGIGKVTFNAPVTLASGTTVNGGTLVVNSSLPNSSLTIAGPTTLTTTTGSVTLYPTLAGNGTVAQPVTLGGAITAGSGATANDSIGILRVTNFVYAGPGSLYEVKLSGKTAVAGVSNGSGGSAVAGTGNDELIVSNVGGAGNLTVTPVVLTGTSFAAGNYSFLIADATSNGAAFSALSGMAVVLPGAFSPGSVASLSVAADGNGGEDLFLDITVAAPEPTSLLLTGVAIAPLSLRRRRRPAN